MIAILDKRMVEQVNNFAFRSFSQCFFSFYFSTGYFCLFYKRILPLLSNEHRRRINPTIVLA